MPDLAGDDALGYQTSRTDFSKTRTLQLDASYRLAHLPLVAPDHPDVIPSVEGKPYRMGKRPEVFSLVVPVAAEALSSSPGYVELVDALRQSQFAAKIDWTLLPRRSGILHATVTGGLSGEPVAPALADLPAFDAELRGLFSGNINLGRLYIKLHPEQQDEGNAITRIQQALGRAKTHLYLVGLFNLIDHLTEAETQELAALIERFWSKPMLRFRVETLWLIGTSDDLALEARIVERIRLG